MRIEVGWCCWPFRVPAGERWRWDMSSKPSAVVDKFTWESIAAAHARIAPRIHRTPVLRSATLDALCGAELFFKCENLQKTGSFKIRGATNAIFSLSDDEASRGI